MAPRRFWRQREARSLPDSACMTASCSEESGQICAEIVADGNINVNDQFEILTKISLFSAMGGLIILALGSLPNCPENCVAKACLLSTDDANTYHGRCLCHSADDSEYCSNESFHSVDKNMFLGAVVLFVISCVFAMVSCGLRQWYKEEIPVQSYYVSSLPHLTLATVITDRTCDTTELEHFLEEGIECVSLSAPSVELSQVLQQVLIPDKPEPVVLYAVAV